VLNFLISGYSEFQQHQQQHTARKRALFDGGALAALVGVVSKGSDEARKQACGALWGLFRSFSVHASQPAALMKLLDCLDTTLQNKEK
jgi:hypothetical protein